MAKISVRDLSLEYPIFSRRRLLPWSGPAGLVGSKLLRRGSTTVVRALEDISFELESGDRLALLGHNGSGKSTLLMTLAGIYPPSAGIIETEGHIEALFNIRLGFRSEATGRRNIILRGLVYGLSRKEIEERMDDIIKFSELGEFIDLPLYSYSSGMAARLAFASATAFQPDILLMDEWIGAGDRSFQDKAAARMDQFVSGAGIVVLATHNERIVKSVCNKAIMLKAGRIEAAGAVSDVIKPPKKPKKPVPVRPPHGPT